MKKTLRNRLVVAITILIAFSSYAQPYPFSEEDMGSSKKEFLFESEGKTFYIISDNFIKKSITKAQIFTEENGVHTVYLTISSNIVRNRDGSIFMDADLVPISFNSWIIENYDRGFSLSLAKDDRFTSDPINFKYNLELDILDRKLIDPSML